MRNRILMMLSFTLSLGLVPAPLAAATYDPTSPTLLMFALTIAPLAFMALCIGLVALAPKLIPSARKEQFEPGIHHPGHRTA